MFDSMVEPENSRKPDKGQARLLEVSMLQDYVPEQNARYLNERRATGVRVPYSILLTSDDAIEADVVRGPSGTGPGSLYVRAGPRRHCFFSPKSVKAAVVTCGGLCPGLNNVIREITLSLRSLYGVAEVHGIMWVSPICL